MAVIIGFIPRNLRSLFGCTSNMLMIDFICYYLEMMVINCAHRLVISLMRVIRFFSCPPSLHIYCGYLGQLSYVIEFKGHFCMREIFYRNSLKYVFHPLNCIIYRASI